MQKRPGSGDGADEKTYSNHPDRQIYIASAASAVAL
jgi:hypothetical protein